MLKRMQLIFTLLALALTAGAKSYVMLVGMADYPGTRNDLKLSANDAEVMKALYGHQDAETVILTNSNATVEAVKKAMTDLFARAGADDAVIFFFSGHGVPGGFVCYDNLLRYDDITHAMLASPAKVKMVWADACYSGKARNTNRRSHKPAETSVMFFLSSRTNETSMEKRTWKNSLFTAYLERGLRGGADTDLNRTITARELFDFVSKGVTEASRDRQHPVMWGNFDNDMPVMSWPKKTDN